MSDKPYTDPPVDAYTLGGKTADEIIPEMPIFTIQEAVSFGETDLDLTTDGVDIIDGTLQLNGDIRDASAANWADEDLGTRTSLGNVGQGVREWRTLANGLGDVEVDFEEIYVAISESHTRNPYLHNIRFYDSGGTSVDVNFSSVRAADDGNGYRERTLDTGPVTATVDRIDCEVENVSSQNDTTFYMNEMSFEAFTRTQANAQVNFSQIPTDIVAWDRISWQYEENDGSLTADVETNDGTGWSVYLSDAVPPVGISSIPPEDDVRLNLTYTIPTLQEVSPVVPYVARRAER